MVPGVSDELAGRLGSNAEHIRRWAEGTRTRLDYADWEDKGNTTARLFAVYANRGDSTRKLIMKCVPKGHRETAEAGRHADAWHNSPPEFREQHLVRQIWDPIALDGHGWIMFQEIAGRNLARTRSMSSLLSQVTGPDSSESPDIDINDAVATVMTALFQAWNVDGVTPTQTSAHEYLGDLLGDRLMPHSTLSIWARERGLLTTIGSDHEPTETRIGDCGNPFALVFPPNLADQRRVYVRRGRAHGDLHPGNILFGPEPGQFWLIDLSRFSLSQPLAFDPTYLLLTTTVQFLDMLTSRARMDAVKLLLTPLSTERSRLRPWVPEPLRALIGAIHDAGEAWADRDSLSEEYHLEILLSFVASGLIMAARRPVHHPVGEWFLEVAAAAADRYAGLQERGTSGLTNPPQTDMSASLLDDTLIAPELDSEFESEKSTQPTIDIHFDYLEPAVARRTFVRTIAAHSVLTAAGGSYIYAAVKQFWPDNNAKSESVGLTSQSGPPLNASARYLWFPEDGFIFATDRLLTPEESYRIEQAAGAEQVEAAARDLDMLQIASLFDSKGPTSQFSRLQIVLEGNREDLLLIQEIRAHVIKASPPLAGTLLYGVPQGESDVVQIAFDLDSVDPIARKPIHDGRPTKTPYISEHVITLAAEEKLALLATAHTARYCEWEILLTIEGQRGPVVIRQPNGQPFRTTAITSQYGAAYVYQLDRQRFVQHPPDGETPWIRK